MMQTCRNRRRGWASIFALVVLAVLSAMIALAAQNVSSVRRLLRDRSANIQVKWLARSGIEIGLDRLKQNKDYSGEVVEIIPGSRLAISIIRQAESQKVQIESAAQYESTGSTRPVATVTRIFDLAKLTNRDRE